MKTTSKRFALTATFGLLWLAPAALAQAPVAGTTDLPSIKVSYADLNVDTPSGLETLTGRINGAVRRVCGDSYATTYLREASEVMDCRQQSRRDAWLQFGRNQERARAARSPVMAAIADRPEPR